MLLSLKSLVQSVYNILILLTYEFHSWDDIYIILFFFSYKQYDSSICFPSCAFKFYLWFSIRCSVLNDRPERTMFVCIRYDIITVEPFIRLNDIFIQLEIEASERKTQCFLNRKKHVKYLLKLVLR